MGGMRMLEDDVQAIKFFFPYSLLQDRINIILIEVIKKAIFCMAWPVDIVLYSQKNQYVNYMVRTILTVVTTVTPNIAAWHVYHS